MRKMKKLFVLLLACMILFGIRVNTFAKTPKLSQEVLTLTVGEKYTLSVENAGTQSVRWSSSKKSVAAVSSKGKVTAKKAGTAQIRASVDGEKLTCYVNVIAKGPILSTTESTLTVGDTLQLTVENAGKKSVKWSSNKKSVASVTSKGKIKAKKAGTAKITAKVGKKKLVCKVTVEEEPEEVIAQAVYSRYVTNSSVKVVTGSNSWIFFRPQIKVTNTGNTPINIFLSNGSSLLNLKPGKSHTFTLNQKSTYTVSVCGASQVGYWQGSARVDAVRSINNLY